MLDGKKFARNSSRKFKVSQMAEASFHCAKCRTFSQRKMQSNFSANVEIYTNFGPQNTTSWNRSSRKFDAMFTKRASLKLFPVPSYSMSAETPAAHTFTFEKQGFWPLKVRIKTNEVRMWVSTFGPGGQILRVDDRSFCRLIRWDLRESWSVCIHKNSGILGLVTFNEHGAIFHLLSKFGASPKVLLKQITMSDLHLKCPDIASQGWYWFVQ